MLAAAQGRSLRGTAEDPLISGEVGRPLLVKLASPVDLAEPVRVPFVEPSQPVTGRQRAARRAVKGTGDAVEAAARAQRVAATWLGWSNAQVGPALLPAARRGKGRRRPMVDTTPVAVPREPGTDEWRGGGKTPTAATPVATHGPRCGPCGTRQGGAPRGGFAPCRGMMCPYAGCFLRRRRESGKGMCDGQLVGVLLGQPSLSQTAAPHCGDGAAEIAPGVAAGSGPAGRAPG